MGLAASQARLLSITSRLSDNELRSQTINNAKMRLASESSLASQNYLNALNDANMMFSNYDVNGLPVSQLLTYNALMSYSSYNNQYGLVNNSGLLLVSEDEADLFARANGNLSEYLASHGLRYDTTYFDPDANGQAICIDPASGYPNEFIVGAETLKEWYEDYSSYANSVEAANYDKYLSEYFDTSTAYRKSLHVMLDEWVFGDESVFMTEKYIKGYVKFTKDAIHDAKSLKDQLDYRCLSMPCDLLLQVGKNLTDDERAAVMDNEDGLYKTYSNALQNGLDYEGNSAIYKSAVYVEDDNNGMHIYYYGFHTGNITDADNDGPKTSADNHGSKSITFIKYEDNGTDKWKYEYINEKGEAGGDDGYASEEAAIAAFNNKTIKDSDGFTIKLNKTADGGFEAKEIFGNSDELIQKFAKNLLNDFCQNVIDDENYFNMFIFGNHVIKDYIDGENTYAIYTSTNSSLRMSYSYYISNYINAAMDYFGLIEGIDYDENTTIKNKYEILTEGKYTDENNKEIEVKDSQLFKIYKDLGISDLYSALVNFDELLQLIQNMNTDEDPDNDIEYSDEFRNVARLKLIDGIIDEYGEPNYTWLDDNDPNQTGNASAKAQWYTNLFNRMSQGYKVLENGLASSSEWLEFALESGIVTMEQVNQQYNWINLDYKTCSNITEDTTSDALVAKAEAEYNRTMREIEAKDRVFDLELKNIETEHSALQKEYDSLKNVMKENIKRTLDFDKSS